VSDDLKVLPLPVADWQASLGHVVEDMKGNPLNVHRLMAHNPSLLGAFWNFRNYSVNGGSLGRRKGELVILRVGITLRAWYEWSSHVVRGQAVGLSLEEIERVKEGPDAAGWDADDALLLKAVDELMAKRRLEDETHRRLRQHYSVEQIIDIMAIQGMYIILGCMINTWGLDLDEHVAEALPAGVTREAFEAEYPLEGTDGDA